MIGMFISHLSPNYWMESIPIGWPGVGHILYLERLCMQREFHPHSITSHILGDIFRGKKKTYGKLLHEMENFKDFSSELYLNCIDKCYHCVNYITISKERMSPQMKFRLSGV